MNPLRLSATAALAVAALAVPTAAASPPPTVTITLASHHYTPNPIYLAGGVPVRLIFINRAGKTHDFHAEQFFAGARILRGRAPGGEVELKKGRSTVIDLVPARGTYKVHCTRPFHAALGMRATIVVT